MECSCYKCISACKHRPGWFMPGEVELSAPLMNMTTNEFFNKYLAIDWFELSDFNSVVFVLAPALKGKPTGEEYPFWPKGECIFLKDGRCLIHEEKPYECRWYDHSKTHIQGKAERIFIAENWQLNQKSITNLLGRKPREK